MASARKFFQLTLWCVFSSLAVAAHGSGNGITEVPPPDTGVVVEPATPSAYQAFDLDFLTSASNRDLRHQSVSIEVTHHLDSGQYSLVVVEYLAREDNVAGAPGALGTGIQGLPAGEYRAVIKERSTDDVSRTDRLNEIETFEFTITPEFANIIGHAMYHPELNHHFLTPIESERHAREDRGWQRQGGFVAWPPEGPAPENADPVCRFHNQTSDSHFYTADQAECEHLRATENDWQYLGLAFRALTPEAGVCPRGTSPIWRLYNGRHAQGDANHAYVRRKAVYRTMMHDGWKGEGIAFCSVPRSYNESQIEQAHNSDKVWP